MKKLVLIIILFTPSIIKAQNAAMQMVPVKNSDSYKMYYESEAKWNLEISIVNEKGKKVEEFKLKDKNGFILPIDFGKYGSGEYLVKVESPAFLLEDKVNFKSQIDIVKEKIVGEVVDGTRLLITVDKDVEGELDLNLINSNGSVFKEHTYDAKTFGMQAFDFAGSPELPISINIFYEGKFINEWTISD